jgi:hypothetical protein
MSELCTPSLSREQSDRRAVQQLLEENQRLREEIAELKRLIFGSKRERFVPATTDTGQLSLELGEEVSQETALVKQTVSYQRAVKQARHTTARQPFPAHLPRIEQSSQPDPSKKGYLVRDYWLKSS